MTSRLSISKFQTYADGKVLAYKGDGDLIRDLEDAGPIRVRLDLGGHMDQVILDSVQSNDLHALTRARETLTAVIERLTPSTPPTARLGWVGAWSGASGGAMPGTATTGRASCPPSRLAAQRASGHSGSRRGVSTRQKRPGRPHAGAVLAFVRRGSAAGGAQLSQFFRSLARGSRRRARSSAGGWKARRPFREVVHNHGGDGQRDQDNPDDCQHVLHPGEAHR